MNYIELITNDEIIFILHLVIWYNLIMYVYFCKKTDMTEDIEIIVTLLRMKNSILLEIIYMDIEILIGTYNVYKLIYYVFHYIIFI